MTVSMTDLTGMRQQQPVCGPAMPTPRRTHRSSGVLMDPAALTLAVKVWLCTMTHV